MNQRLSLLLVLALTTLLASAQSATFQYDALGRVISAAYPNGAIVSYEYDANGNRTEMEIVLGNHGPDAIDDTASKAAASISTLSVLSNDTDADSHPLVITAISTPSRGGTATAINGATQISYTAGAVGTETFHYTISDGNGGFDTASVIVTVTNTPPDAVNDAYTKTSGSTSTLTVLVNDTDANGHALVITSVTTPSAGGTALRISNNTEVSYTAGAVGTETFSYTISDGNAGTDTATVNVTVQPGEIVTLNPSASTTYPTTIVFTIAQLATLNGNAATIQSMTVPGGCGSRTIAGGGQSVTYTPPNYSYNYCVDVEPPPSVCDVPYVIRKTATSQDYSGIAHILVYARAIAIPDPCP